MKYVAMTLAAFVLAGCQYKTQTIQVAKQVDQIQIITPEKPRAITTKKVDIVVFDRQKLEVALADPNFRRIIGMTDKDYAAISHNYNEAIRFINAQAAVIEYYERVLEELKKRNVVTDVKQ